MNQETWIDSRQPKKKKKRFLAGAGKLLSHVKKQRRSFIQTAIFPKPKEQLPGWKTAACMAFTFPKAFLFPSDRFFKSKMFVAAAQDNLDLYTFF